MKPVLDAAEPRNKLRSCATGFVTQQEWHHRSGTWGLGPPHPGTAVPARTVDPCYTTGRPGNPVPSVLAGSRPRRGRYLSGNFDRDRQPRLNVGTCGYHARKLSDHTRALFADLTREVAGGRDE